MKATLYAVMSAIDSLPEQEDAMLDSISREAYSVACDRVLAEMGWTREEFVFGMSECLGQPIEE
jgi:hypothetical protein